MLVTICTVFLKTTGFLECCGLFLLLAGSFLACIRQRVLSAGKSALGGSDVGGQVERLIFDAFYV